MQLQAEQRGHNDAANAIELWVNPRWRLRGRCGRLTAFIVAHTVRNTRNDPLEVGEGILDLRTIARDHELADALVVPGTAHFERSEPGHLRISMLQHQDRVGDGGDVRVGDRMAAHELLGGVREEAGNLLLLGITGDADHELAEGVG